MAWLWTIQQCLLCYSTCQGSGDDDKRQELHSQLYKLPERWRPMYICAVEAKIQLTEQVIDDCMYHPTIRCYTFIPLPQCCIATFFPILEKYKDCFAPGHTDLAEHFIPMSGTPVKVPPRGIPTNYRAEVQH